jgi:malonyl-CoA decarboxylase
MIEAKTYFEKLVGKGRDLAAKTVKRLPKGAPPLEQIKSISSKLLTARGQASGIKMAEDLHKIYLTCSEQEKFAYFEFLLSEFGRDKDKLMATCQSYANDPSHDTLKRLTVEMEPRRQELFKRMNMAPGGTMALVDMRTDLLRFLKSSPELKPVDIDFLSLFKTWFNRGFLTMEPISWKSPAVILERLIAYEAVHEIKSWDDLKSRLDPVDRLCYAFFHPNLKDTPLIFVEVALCETIPNSIQDILASDRTILPDGQAKVAAFYSINNCLTGLKGIYFGNFLLKQVVAHLQVAQPQLKSFVTLSPIPGLKSWLNTDNRAATFGLDAQDLERLESPIWFKDPKFAAKTKKSLRQAALAYLIDRQPNSHRLYDSVARFHLGNGARIENIHWLADSSTRGLSNSYGMMVNYLYELSQIENNHEAFAVRHELALSGDMQRLKKQIGAVKTT